jgi:hypothetical protein
MDNEQTKIHVWEFDFTAGVFCPSLLSLIAVSQDWSLRRELQSSTSRREIADHASNR